MMVLKLQVLQKYVVTIRRDENMDTDEDVIENEEELEETTDNNSEAQVSTVQEDN